MRVSELPPGYWKLSETWERHLKSLCTQSYVLQGMDMDCLHRQKDLREVET